LPFFFDFFAMPITLPASFRLSAQRERRNP
jgi:hypothetical protein